MFNRWSTVLSNLFRRWFKDSVSPARKFIEQLTVRLKFGKLRGVGENKAFISGAFDLPISAFLGSNKIRPALTHGKFARVLGWRDAVQLDYLSPGVRTGNAHIECESVRCYG